MPASYLHGVETMEELNGIRSLKTVPTAIIGLIGSAYYPPITKPEEKIQQIQIINNEKQALKLYGEGYNGFTLPLSLRAIYSQGGGIVTIINVFNPEKHKSTSKTMVLELSDIDKSINLSMNLCSVKFEFFLKDSNIVDSSKLKEGSHFHIDYRKGLLSLDKESISLVIKDVDNLTLKVSYTTADPEKISTEEVLSAIDLLPCCEGVYGIRPRLLIAPWFSEEPPIAGALIEKAEKMRAFTYIDAPEKLTPTDLLQVRGGNKESILKTSSQRVRILYPRLKTWNKADNCQISIPYSPYMAGVRARVDLNEGYWTSASNKEIYGVMGSSKHLTAKINDPSCEVNMLNEKGITTLFSSGSSGIRVWGNRTASWPVKSDIRNFENVRRTADVIEDTIEETMLQYLDQSVSSPLIDTIVASINAFLRSLTTKGAIVQGKCWFDPAENTPDQIAEGKMKFSYDFLPPVPAERITCTAIINTNYLKGLGE